jgi:hypothetical protein
LNLLAPLLSSLKMRTLPLECLLAYHSQLGVHDVLNHKTRVYKPNCRPST